MSRTPPPPPAGNSPIGPGVSSQPTGGPSMPQAVSQGQESDATSGPAGSTLNPSSRFERRIAQPTMHPRRVIGGTRLQTRGAKADGEAGPNGAPAPVAPSAYWTWASARWMRLAEEHAAGEQLAEGLEYARIGQTRQIDIAPGSISARVQGRMPTAYRVSLRLPVFTAEQWEAVAGAMASQAKYSASLLGGELPANIEDLFAPAGLQLFPLALTDLSCACDCDVFRKRSIEGSPMSAASVTSVGKPAAGKNSKAGVPKTPLCKHICCTMYLLAERLAQQPLLIFSLRGMPESDLVERLRTQRAIAGLQRAGGSAAPIYTPHTAVTNRADTPLEECVHSFWNAEEADALDGLDMPIEPPAVSHPLLRRVGPSPFATAKFPLVGLLATCYDVISQDVIRSTRLVPSDELSNAEPGETSGLDD